MKNITIILASCLIIINACSPAVSNSVHPTPPVPDINEETLESSPDVDLGEMIFKDPINNLYTITLEETQINQIISKEILANLSLPAKQLHLGLHQDNFQVFGQIVLFGGQLVLNINLDADIRINDKSQIAFEIINLRIGDISFPNLKQALESFINSSIFEALKQASVYVVGDSIEKAEGVYTIKASIAPLSGMKGGSINYPKNTLGTNILAISKCMEIISAQCVLSEISFIDLIDYGESVLRFSSMEKFNCSH